MAGYTDNEQNVILAEASKLDFDDIMAFGPHYFGCGWMKYKYYNLNYAVALSLIGRLYGDKESKNSDYHKGVVYISDALGISKRQVKILRKKVKHGNGSWFKIPYTTAAIIKKIINKLRETEQEEYVSSFLKKCNSTVYREILIPDQFEAIKAARKGERQKVLDLADELKDITIKVGDNS